MAERLTFQLPDPDEEYVAVRVCSDIGRWELARNGDGWALEREAPPLQRLEYVLEVERPDGSTESLCDPVNPQRAPGVFGEKSVLELGGYEPPWWLEADRSDGEHATLTVRSRALKSEVEIGVWSPAGSDEPLPLLLANDGPEYDELSSLTLYAQAMIGSRELRPFRVALLAPEDRDEWYSAAAAYSRALTTELLPALRAEHSVDGRPVAMGASLGGLAMLHAQRRWPGTFAGLFLQSASFFLPRFDSQESGFPRWQRIVRFARTTLGADRAQDPVPVAMTCGACEENRFNNRVLADALARQGHDVHYAEVADSHNYIGWRDAFDPHLTDLLVRAWWT